MFDNLTKRIDGISAVVDYHVKNLLEEQSEASPLMERQILDLTTSKKLILLELNEGTLKDRYTANNKETCLRMKGITQSYFLYDSVLYKSLKSIVRQIEKETNVEPEDNQSKEVLLDHQEDTRQ